MPDKYNVDITLGELLDDEVSGKYLRETLGEEVIDNPQMQMAMGFSLRQIPFVLLKNIFSFSIS
ncbi:MAG: hypothetical protein ACFE85_17610 [Candidatus Hodarchaeota archaeon]